MAEANEVVMHRIHLPNTDHLVNDKTWGDGRNNRINLTCPICGFDYSHIQNVFTLMGEDEHEAEVFPGTRIGGKTDDYRSALAIEIEGECCHTWRLVIQQYKGVNYLDIEIPNDGRQNMKYSTTQIAKNSGLSLSTIHRDINADYLTGGTVARSEKNKPCLHFPEQEVVKWLSWRSSKGLPLEGLQWLRELHTQPTEEPTPTIEDRLRASGRRRRARV